MLLFFGISVAAILGTYIRIGISYYKIFKSDTNYCILWANIIGSIIMGFVVEHKKYFEKHSSLFNKTIYIVLTSGLCGSITSFSSW